MHNFVIAAINVGIMLLYLLVGFFLTKTKIIKEQGIKGLTVLLMYVSQPFLTLYSFQKVDRSSENTIDMILAFVIDIITILLFLLIIYLIFRKKYKDIKFRILSISAGLGNVAFLGVPIIEAILPEYTKGAMLCCAFLTANVLVGWSLCCFVITLDKKYLSIKKILLNPAMIGFIVSIVLYAFNFKLSSISYVGSYLDNAISILAKMSTPICMIILGSRLGLMSFKQIFLNPLAYLCSLIKLLIVPILILLILKLFNFDNNFVSAIVIISSAPCAQIAQGFAELVGMGQDDAASNVLLSTILCIITIPLICLLLA